MTTLTDVARGAELDLFCAIDRSAHVSERFQVLLLGSTRMTKRYAIAAALFSICLEHRESVLLLVRKGARTSAMALGRPTLEAYVTGLWVHRLATEAELSSFMGGRSPASYERMSQRLRKVHEFGELFETLRAHYATLSDYTHGYSRQVSRWIGPEGIGPRHADGEIVSLLRFVDAIGILACIAQEKLADRPVEELSLLLGSVLYGTPILEGPDQATE